MFIFKKGEVNIYEHITFKLYLKIGGSLKYILAVKM